MDLLRRAVELPMEEGLLRDVAEKAKAYALCHGLEVGNIFVVGQKCGKWGFFLKKTSISEIYFSVHYCYK